MYVINMVPTDYVTFDDSAKLILDSIVNNGLEKYLHLKWIQEDDEEQDINLFKNINAELNYKGKSFPLEVRRIQPSCGKIYFSDAYNDISIKYHKGVRRSI